MADPLYRALKLSRAKNPVVKQFWTQIATKAGGEASLENIIPYIVSKFDVFTANDYMRPIIGQQKSSFNFRDIMDNKKILLVNLSKGRLGDINANLIGLILVGKILMAALSRVDSIGKSLPPFYLYVDEFQNVTTDSIATILSEARKYKLSMTIAHQFIKQLDERDQLIKSFMNGFSEIQTNLEEVRNKQLSLKLNSAQKGQFEKQAIMEFMRAKMEQQWEMATRQVVINEKDVH
jgi:hypothetical protein